jgi:glyoxylase I family protein
VSAGSLNHLRLSVRDPAVSERLYDPVLSALGWVQIPRDDGGRAWERHDPTAGAQWLILTPVGDEHRNAPPHDLRAPGFHHLALNAADRDQVHRVHEILVGLGAEILDAPAEYDYDPGYYAVFFLDPDGLKLEVVHIP